jgi:hypothetical protein
MKRLGCDAAELTALADHLTAHGLVLEMLAGPLPGIYDPTGPGRILFGFFAAMAEIERENIREAGLDSAARKGNHGGRPAVITDDMPHTVLRRRAAGESVESIRPDLIIPIGKRTGQNPSLASIYRVLTEHVKAEAYLEAVAHAHSDFAALRHCSWLARYAPQAAQPGVSCGSGMSRRCGLRLHAVLNSPRAESVGPSEAVYPVECPATAGQHVPVHQSGVVGGQPAWLCDRHVEITSRSGGHQLRPQGIVAAGTAVRQSDEDSVDAAQQAFQGLGVRNPPVRHGARVRQSSKLLIRAKSLVVARRRHVRLPSTFHAALDRQLHPDVDE